MRLFGRNTWISKDAKILAFRTQKCGDTYQIGLTIDRDKGCPLYADYESEEQRQADIDWIIANDNAAEPSLFDGMS